MNICRYITEIILDFVQSKPRPGGSPASRLAETLGQRCRLVMRIIGIFWEAHYENNGVFDNKNGDFILWYNYYNGDSDKNGVTIICFFWIRGNREFKKRSLIWHPTWPLPRGLRIPIAFPGWSFNAVSKSWTFMAMSQAHGGAGTWSSFDWLFPCVKWLSPIESLKSTFWNNIFLSATWSFRTCYFMIHPFHILFSPHWTA